MASPEHERHVEGEWDSAQLLDREAEEKRFAVLQRDAERERLLWLSLPGNDHPTYYSDSEADGHEHDRPSPSPTVAAAAADVDLDPYLRQAADNLKRQDPTASQLRAISKRATAQRYRYHPVLAADQREEARSAVAQKVLHGYRSGNRGNKLKREEGARYANRFKLSNWSDGKSEKEVSDSSKQRTKALQRASIRSLLNAAASAEGIDLEMAEGSSQQQLSDAQDIAHLLADEEMTEAHDALYDDKGIGPSSRPENLTSTSLAPTLLRPVLTPLALLESQTLRHTFRNPHIGALSKTALDLIESESVVGRALGRCFAAIESGGMPGWATYQEGEGPSRSARLPRRTSNEGADGLGSESEHQVRHGRQGSGGRRSAQSLSLSLANLAPALSQLEHLFITPGGIDVPNGQFVGRPADSEGGGGGDEIPPVAEGAPAAAAPMSTEGAQSQSASGAAAEKENERVHEDGNATNAALSPAPPPGEPEMTHLDVDQQRALVRAALECLYELAQDSREYVERLQEVREKLAQVKIGRARIWGAVRGWALGEVEDEVEQRRNEQLPSRGQPTSGGRGGHHHHHHHHNIAGGGDEGNGNGGGSVDGSSTGTRGKSGRSGRSSRAGRGQGQEGGSSRSGRQARQSP